MIIRDGKDPLVWAALRYALGGRGPSFVVRESLPEASIAWSRARLPLVLISPDLREQLATSFVRLVPNAPSVEPFKARAPGAGG